MINNMNENAIVNLTGESIFLYDDVTGEIREFESKKVSGLLGIAKVKKGFSLYYAVDDMDTLLELLRAGGKLGQIATVSEKSMGRDEKVISTLKWAKDPATIIRFRPKSTF